MTTPDLKKLIEADIAEREAFGMRKYGRALAPGDRRDMLREAYEEQIDALYYLRLALYERDGV